MIEKIFYKYEDIIHALVPDEQPEQVDCSKSILCDCQRRSCLGRTVSTSYYVRKIKEAV